MLGLGKISLAVEPEACVNKTLLPVLPSLKMWRKLPGQSTFTVSSMKSDIGPFSREWLVGFHAVHINHGSIHCFLRAAKVAIGAQLNTVTTQY
jgi:hypothetical protein